MKVKIERLKIKRFEDLKTKNLKGWGIKWV